MYVTLATCRVPPLFKPPLFKDLCTILHPISCPYLPYASSQCGSLENSLLFFKKKKKLFLFSLHKKKIPMKVFSTTTAYPLCSAVCQACQNSAGSPHGMHVCVRTLPWCGQDVGCKMKPTSCPQVCKKKILNLDRRLFVGWMHWLY